MATRPKKWWVITPEFDIMERVDEYGGPTYTVRDVIQVMAKTRKDAVLVGVKLMLKHTKWEDEGFTYVHEQRDSGLCPFTGVRAYRLKELGGLDERN